MLAANLYIYSNRNKNEEDKNKLKNKNKTKKKKAKITLFVATKCPKIRPASLSTLDYRPMETDDTRIQTQTSTTLRDWWNQLRKTPNCTLSSARFLHCTKLRHSQTSVGCRRPRCATIRTNTTSGAESPRVRPSPSRRPPRRLGACRSCALRSPATRSRRSPLPLWQFESVGRTKTAQWTLCPEFCKIQIYLNVDQSVLFLC